VTTCRQYTVVALQAEYFFLEFPTEVFDLYIGSKCFKVIIVTEAELTNLLSNQ